MTQVLGNAKKCKARKMKSILVNHHQVPTGIKRFGEFDIFDRISQQVDLKTQEDLSQSLP